MSVYKFVFVSLCVSIIALYGVILSPIVLNEFRMVEAQAQKSGSEVEKLKKVTLVTNEKPMLVAPNNRLHPGGIIYNAMVFNDTIPGPVIAINQGDTLQVTLRNDGKVTHSLVFQGVSDPTQAISQNVEPGSYAIRKLKFDYPGVFLYYDGADQLNNVWQHVANGMYGGVVVHPINELPAKEFYLVFSEIYATNNNESSNGTTETTSSFDITKFLNDQPDLILTNGMAFKYMPRIGKDTILDLNKDSEAFKVKPGELTRWYIVNAGPRQQVSLNFIGSIINARDVLFASSKSYSTQLKSYQTWSIPPGSASVIEAVFPINGSYIGIDHDLGRMLKGAAFAVIASPRSTNYDQPIGTSVPSNVNSAVGPINQSNVYR